jgi:TRAP-type C4-dicarboxylate transport system permease small subunit
VTDPIRRLRDRYGRVLEWVVSALMVVLAVEVTLGVVFRGIGHSLIWYDEVASVLPILATDALVSLPSIPMSVVQSVIPISAALIVVAELLHLVDLIAHRTPPAAPAAGLAEALQ